MHSNHDLVTINNRLTDYYGRDITGMPFFRVVWSEGLLEKRVGHFEDFYGSIFLRAYDGLREVPKYSYIKNRHILEKLVFHKETKEILEKHSYEPVYVFQDKNGKSLPVIWRACEALIHSLMYGERQKLTASDMIAEEEKKDKRDVEYFEDSLDMSYTATMLANKEAIVVPSNYNSVKE